MKKFVKAQMDNAEISGREKTHAALKRIIEFLSKNYADFSSLPINIKLDLAMKHYQCERGRLQKGKIYLDVIGRYLIPIIAVLGALLFGLKKL